MFNEKTNAIAVKINNTYKPDMTDFQLYDTCRTAWDIDKEKEVFLNMLLLFAMVKLLMFLKYLPGLMPEQHLTL